MPELPEVETVVRDLCPRLVGRRLGALAFSGLPLRREWRADWAKSLRGARVQEVRRRGKWILIGLNDGPYLVIHLGMTGQLVVLPAGERVAPHTHLVVDLDGGREQLRFRDTRRFGSATLFPDLAQVEAFFERTGLGPEPFELKPGYWRACLAQTARCLKAVLLDQRVVAGVGNIYADEALFQARLHPAQVGRATTPQEAARLGRAVVTVLERAITKRGSSIRDYVGGSGVGGRYQHEFRVYQRSGEPCPRCRRPIQRMRLAGRSTHFCLRCQPLTRARLA